MFKVNISLFKSLFHGREDLFAIRRDKDGKSAYLPSCDFDPYLDRPPSVTTFCRLLLTILPY